MTSICPRYRGDEGC